jgi:hypothetical protein
MERRVRAGMTNSFGVQGSGFRVPGCGTRPVALALAGLVLAAATARGQGLNSLPTPLPQPFSPNGVLRPIIPIQPSLPIPTTRPLSVVPLPTPAPNIRIAPLKTPSSVVANQAQGLIKAIPMHRRWPVLQPLDTPKPAAGGASARTGGGTARIAGPAAPAFSSPGVPDHRRPLGW